MKREEYFLKAWEVVRRIPKGKVATYGQVAYLAGFGWAPRIAGQAMAASCGDVPAHRVVNAKGRTAPFFTSQRQLLEEEGVSFKPNGCVDLKKHLYLNEENAG